MKNINYIAISLLATSIFAACTNEQPVYESGISSENEILIGKARISDHQTKATSPETSTIATIEDSNMSLTITETVEPMFGNQTKADALDYTGLTDIGVLEDNGFDVYGYYKTTNGSTWNKFIDGKKTTHKDASCYEGADISDYWCFDTPIKWRHSSYHYFWAYAPETNVSNFAGDPVAETATFDYTSDFEHDLVFAHNGMFWDYNQTCAKGAHTGDQLDLTFDHALAGIKINYLFEILAAMDKDGKVVEPAEDRISITSIDLTTKNGGKCTINKDNTFTWTPGTGSTKHVHDIAESENATSSKVSLKGQSNGADFIIPQNAIETIGINILDKKKRLQYPIIVSLKNIFNKVGGSGSKTDKKYEAGDMYNYNLEGTITASYQPKGVDGIKFHFDAKDLHDTLIVAGIDGKHISKMRISWEGVPNGNGSAGNMAMIVLMPHKENWAKDKDNLVAGTDCPVWNKRANLNDTSLYKNVVFGIVSEGGSTSADEKRGHIDDYKDKDGKTITDWFKSYCYTDIIDFSTLPDNIKNGDFDIFVAYVGANNSGNPVWDADNFSIEIIEYK